VVERRFPWRRRRDYQMRLLALWKGGPISGYAARSVAGQGVSSILSHTFPDEGEFA
jgi:hypothetical protein